MATYGAGISINGLVNATRSSTGTIYTVPSGNYAILNWDLNVGFGATATLEMNGAAYASIAGTANVSSLMILSGTGQPVPSGPIYAGPGQAVNTTITGGTANVYLTGPLFNG